MSYVKADPTAFASARSIARPDLLHGLFEIQSLRRPTHPAIECRGKVLTYGELDRLANRFAHYFRSLALGPGRLVALHLEKSVELFAAILGVLKAGAGYVPIDPKFPAERINSILEDGRITLVVSQTSLAKAAAQGLCVQTLLIDRDLDKIAAMPDTPVPPAETGVQPSDICYVIYTSGSTGRPKGVIIEHRNAVRFAASLPTVYGITEDDRVYQGFSVAFDAAVEEVWAAFSIGGTLFVPTDELTRSPQDVASFITQNRITFFSTVPSFLAMIGAPLPTVRLLIVGGEALAAELVARWADGRRMLNTYGPTEATVVATLCEVRPGQLVTIGTALPGYETYVLDEEMRPVEPGRDGELYIGGDAVARGYMNRPELTAEKFVCNPFCGTLGASPRLYRTHDLVRSRADGEIEFLGRIDGQIKIRGFRVELSEIEAVLMEQVGIRAAAVGAFDINGFKELAAFVVAADGSADIDRAAAVEQLRAKLPEYMLPKFLDVVDELPRMTSGKIDRKQLPNPKQLLAGSISRTIIAPRTEMERLVVEAWTRALNNADISVADDFFLDLGGHSLVAAHAVTALRTKLGNEQISMRDLYTHRTAEKLAIHIERIARKQQPSQSLAAFDATVSPSQKAFENVPAWERAACYALQAVSLAAYYAAIGFPGAMLVFMVMGVIEGNIRIDIAGRTLVVAGFLFWPAYLALSIGVKWLVVGRFEAGRVPLWSLAYYRFWVVRLFQGLSGAGFFSGTPLMGLYYRAMGAKVGRDAVIATTHCVAYDLVSIGNRASIGAETQLLGYRVEDGMLVLGTVAIGDECFVGMHCGLGLDVAMNAGARLDDLSLLADNSRMAESEARRGVPAEQTQVQVPEPRGGEQVPRRPILFGLCHLALVYVMGYVAIFSILPSIYLVAYALEAGVAWGIAATFVAVPLAIVVYALAVLGLKRFVLGREKAGTFPLHSGEYLTHWLLDGLLGSLRRVLMPVYATIYLPPLLRLFGARIGANAEISTILHVSPDLLEVGEGSFLADACLVGGKRIHNGLFEVKPNRIGARSFIGNSALVPGGIDVGNDCLVGVQSTPPAATSCTPDGTRWLGSPGFELPRTQGFTCFSAEETYRPTPALYRTRAMIDAVRIVLPALLIAAGLVAFVALMAMAWIHLPLWAATLSIPAAMILLSCAAILMSAGIKGVLIGTYEPTVKPLWSKFVWLNELVNGVYENIAGSALQPMLGTPFAVFGLRLMGCKIGRRVFMDTTLFSEFDLAEIGAYAAVNYGATIQTHLFEDRIMKADRLEIGEGASVGNMAVVLYGTEMKLGACLGSLSVLMKGEKLAPLSRWYGIPTQPMPALDQAANRRGAEPCLAAAGVRSRLRLAAPADRGPARPMPDAVPARRGVPNRHLAEAA